MASKIRVNFHSESEANINKQINMELHASYVYMAMASYFNRDDVALHGFAKRFQENSDEERGHAMKLIDYQNMRGGRVVFHDINKPVAQEWSSALHAIECQLELEQSVHKALLELHKCADSHGDAQLTDFIEGEYLKEQVEAEKEVGDMVTKIKRVGSDGLGIHIIDKELQ
jgi:ferritin heavy chain